MIFKTTKKTLDQATQTPQKKRGLSLVLISTAGDRSFLRKTRIISGAYFYCWRQKFSQKNEDYLECLFLLLATEVFSEKQGLSRVLISTAGDTSFLRKTGIISGAYFYCWRHKFSQENISLGYIHYIFHLLFFSLKRYIFATGEKEITYT